LYYYYYYYYDYDYYYIDEGVSPRRPAWRLNYVSLPGTSILNYIYRVDLIFPSFPRRLDNTEKRHNAVAQWLRLYAIFMLNFYTLGPSTKWWLFRENYREAQFNHWNLQFPRVGLIWSFQSNSKIKIKMLYFRFYCNTILSVF